MFENNPGSYHGYAIQNYMDVDKRWGTKEELEQLVDKAHALDIRVFWISFCTIREIIGPIPLITTISMRKGNGFHWEVGARKTGRFQSNSKIRRFITEKGRSGISMRIPRPKKETSVP